MAHWFPRLERLRERWRDPSLTVLLVVQCISIFGLVPATAMGLPLPPAFVIALLLVFMSLTILMARGRWTVTAGFSTLVMAAVVNLLQAAYPGAPIRIAGEIVAIATFSALSVVVFRAIFAPGRFTAHRVRGVIVLYLNIGLLFGLLHRGLSELIPGAYSSLPRIEGTAAFRAAIDYFSFTTLTSLGYGDILPVHPIARGLATLEAVIGQLYPPTLLARVVTMEIAARQS